MAILDADEFDDTNEKILQVVEGLAEKYGINFFIKNHPSNNLNDSNLEEYILRDNKTLGLNPHFVGYRSSLLLELAAFDNFFLFCS